jgi:hypothetical protein
LLEIFFAIYGCLAVFIAIFSGNPIYAPMMAIPTIGFIYIAYLSIAHSALRKKKGTASSHAEPTGPAEKPVLSAKVILAGIVAFLVLGAAVAYYGYYSTIYPVTKAVGFLSRAETAQTPEQLAEYIELTKALVPKAGNPVWLFPTVRTDFALIQIELDETLARADAVSSMEPHSEAYNMAMMNMHHGADAVKINLIEALPYMHISFTNVLLSVAWISVIMAVFAAMRKVRAKQQQLQYKTV